MAAARQANLSFLAITDHNVAMTAQDIADDPPDLPIISGEELSTSAGHFLALGMPAGWDRPKTPDDRHCLPRLARPAPSPSWPIRIIRARPGPTGKLPILTAWKSGMRTRSGARTTSSICLIALLIYPVNDQLAMVRLARTPEPNFAKWDELLAQRPVVGMCGSDVHAKTKLGHGLFLRFPGYVPSLEVAREHVLLGPDAGGGDAQSRERGGNSRRAQARPFLLRAGRALSLQRIRCPGFQRRSFRRPGRFSLLGGERDASASRFPPAPAVR